MLYAHGINQMSDPDTEKILAKIEDGLWPFQILPLKNHNPWITVFVGVNICCWQMNLEGMDLENTGDA